MSFLSEVWAYLKARKKFWLLPIILILLFMGLIMAFGAVTGLTPLLYPVF